MKRSTLPYVVTTLALALLGGSAIAATMMANNSNKGSVLVFPRIDVSPGYGHARSRSSTTAPATCR